MASILSKITSLYIIGAAIQAGIEYQSQIYKVNKFFLGQEMQAGIVSDSANESAQYLNHLQKLRCAEMSCFYTSTLYGLTWPVALSSQVFLGKRPAYITDLVSKNVSEIAGQTFRFC